MAIGKAEPFARALPEAQNVITNKATSPLIPKNPDST